MLEHLNRTLQKPSRVVVLGAYGFVGGTCARLLAARGIPVLPLDKDDIDLMAPGAAEQLQTRLAPDDTILVVSARAPCKDTGMMVDNIRIMHAVCTALERSSVNHVVYFSSDAVYSDAPVPLTEESRTEPGSMHGTMHLARELMLKASVKAPLAVVRSTLIYGRARGGGARDAAAGRDAARRLPTVRHCGLPPRFSGFPLYVARRRLEPGARGRLAKCIDGERAGQRLGVHGVNTRKRRPLTKDFKMRPIRYLSSP